MTSSSSSDERTVAEDIDDECITTAPDTFVSARCIGVIDGATAERTVLVSSVPLGAFAGGRGAL